MSNAGKTLHFVWAGSNVHELPFEAVQRAARTHPDHEVIVWYDPNLLRRDDPRFRRLATVEAAGNVRFKPLAPAWISSPELQAYGKERWFPSVPWYASSSDLLRNKILHRFGGAYFDGDMTPGTSGGADSDI